MVAAFAERLKEVNPLYIAFDTLKTLQINLGNLCNLNCTHCHVSASARGTKVMGTGVMEKIARFLSRHQGLTLDITGGCPEMNPDFRFLIERTDGLAAPRIVRSNLAIMAEPGMEWLPEYCSRHGLTITASLPCYQEENVDRQRGKGVYAKSIAVLKELNSLGYGKTLELNLVYNPGGHYLPGSQEELQGAYKTELFSRHGIVFNNLFTITNAPVGRFRDYLEAQGSYERYMNLLAIRFNPAAAGGIMCRTLISVDWQGGIYNCDFNQAIGMHVARDDGSPMTIDDLDEAAMVGREIHLSQHCYCCTAGEGSSCAGALAL
ncbi:arsenosugar biosynthesis radical SAM (seleno)protein ArsS [Geobacter argillaceus]|uniref:Radical SAM/Cys-rich protein n=1 Tax=Geobacter argillaceus TaxID=345631 RepID=A0A562V6P5_9BACT|nr:arsenosugar biosynthesis radical SAM (seleno)protein ArsS [Geobacter argillaceus]TWJ13418.1 radical SAM/Cys-rich protein [Geobacter argillaceus]